MSDSIPYLGSKISLISKSEIRYEGILYTIDAQDSIIALAKVRSFGTEDRPTEMPVPAKNDIYEYIIFRGTDIKKIEVCETPKQQLSGVHNDPAIVGLQVQQQSNAPVGTSYPSTSFGHQPLGPIGSVGPYYGNFGGQLGHNAQSSGFSLGGATSQPSELGGSFGGVSVDPQSPSRRNRSIPAPIGAPPQSSQQDILVGSRSSTPSTLRKSPVVDAGVQVSPRQPQQQQQQHHNQQQQQPRQIQNEKSPAQQPRPLDQIHTEKPFRDTSESHHLMRRGNPVGRNSGYYNNMSQQGGQRHQYQGGYQNYPSSHYQNQYHGGMVRGGRPNRRPQQMRGRGGVGYSQGGRQRQDQAIFEKEFDFEQANEEFEELRTQLAKTKISTAENGGDHVKPEDEEQEKKHDEKKEDSGHETATTGDESEDSNSSNFYDKSKSFFDSISCEAIERSKGKSQKSDWRVERKINVQTFGVATARRGYYNRGGRGGFYPRGGGGGGYYRNYNNQGGYYRGGQNYRGSRGGSYNNQGSSNYNRNQSNGAAPSQPSSSNAGNGGSSYASALIGSATASSK